LRETSSDHSCGCRNRERWRGGSNQVVVLDLWRGLRSSGRALPSHRSTGTGVRSDRDFALFPRSGGLMVIEDVLEGRDRGGGPPSGAAGSLAGGSHGVGQNRPAAAMETGRQRTSLIARTPCHNGAESNEGTAGESIGRVFRAPRREVTKVQSSGSPVSDRV